MPHIAFRARVDWASVATGRRAFSSRASKITAYLRDLSSLTRDPVWRLVMALDSPQRLALSEALDAAHVSLDDFSRWRPSIYASEIEKAMEHKPVSTLSAHPSWLVLYLAGFKVRTPQHASGPLMDLSFAHIDIAPPTIQGPLLVVTMMHLARFDLILPMRRVIDAFLLVPLTQFQNMHFNHLLAAMTSITQCSRETGENAVKVLRAMEGRQLQLWPRTSSALMEDRYTALQLTGYLRRRTTHMGIVPTAAQLEPYLRFYSPDGAIHDAKRYADAVSVMRLGASDEQASAHANNVNVQNTSLIRSQPDSASAFQFLHQLTAATTRDWNFHPRERLSIHPRPLLAKRSTNVYDHNAALSVAVHDRTVSAKQLMRLFIRRPPLIGFRPTVASYTIFIRGLLLRREWKLAYIYWTKLARSGQPLDEAALAVGLQAVALSGRPAEAFALLEMHAARADPALLSLHRPRRPRVTTGTINMLMSSLHRVLRPDLAFRLWDAMEELYGLRPSNETLRIVLEAAQLPHTLDDSFSGQMALLALKNPFRHPPRAPETRAELAASLAKQAAAPYRAGIWRGRPATETASHIFLQAALGVPERLHLAALEPPAYAVRPNAGSDSAAPTLRLDMHPPRFELPSDILTPAGRARFPEVALRERDFAAHVMLLGMTRRAPEIARTLVWMRALGVRPTLRTLGVALAFWGEVSVQPPLVAAMAGRGGDQYLKLVQWLEEWCAEVPDEETVGRWRARITVVRTQRRETAQGLRERFVDEEHIWKM
ncbi:hypothetical protein DFH07DRAFT_992909 [Mycena maculata]|uniref:Uncharacterized protein n=1 Tax=Mycena maculata TaxID=230809 RepID=A0AAD7HXU1_9AGAR|nr:hypothetical protein DFH07DRAFT_992909 [Mycena maculata]